MQQLHEQRYQGARRNVRTTNIEYIYYKNNASDLNIIYIFLSEMLVTSWRTYRLQRAQREAVRQVQHTKCKCSLLCASETNEILDHKLNLSSRIPRTNKDDVRSTKHGYGFQTAGCNRTLWYKSGCLDAYHLGRALAHLLVSSHCDDHFCIP